MVVNHYTIANILANVNRCMSNSDMSGWFGTIVMLMYVSYLLSGLLLALAVVAGYLFVRLPLVRRLFLPTSLLAGVILVVSVKNKQIPTMIKTKNAYGKRGGASGNNSPLTNPPAPNNITRMGAPDWLTVPRFIVNSLSVTEKST